MNAILRCLIFYLGCYLTLFSGRLIFLRWLGYTLVFRLVDATFGFLPFIGVPALLVIALVTTNKHDWGAYEAVKIPIVILATLSPLIIHTVMCGVTYFINPPTRWWVLSFDEWLALLVGCVLMIFAFTWFSPKKHH